MSKKSWGGKIFILLLAAVMATTFTPAAAESATTVYSMGELRTAALAESVGSGDITLGADITDINDAANGAGLLIERDLTLDLKGHTLSIDLSNNNANAIKISNDSTLTILDSSAGKTGKLNAANSNSSGGAVAGFCAGINTTDGTLIIQSGTINATGGDGGAGIGGGTQGNGGNIKISGGTINATGGNEGAGIGGGYRGNGGDIKISGGTVTASGGIRAIGHGSGGNDYGGNPIADGFEDFRYWVNFDASHPGGEGTLNKDDPFTYDSDYKFIRIAAEGAPYTAGGGCGAGAFGSLALMALIPLLAKDKKLFDNPC